MARSPGIEKAEQNFADACLFHIENHDLKWSAMECQEQPCKGWNLMDQWAAARKELDRR